MSKNLIIDGQTLTGVTVLKATDADTGLLDVFPDTSDATASSGDITSGKTAYVNGAKITGTSGESSLDGIIDGTLTTFTMPAGKTTIAPYRFYNFASLTSADLTGTVNINDYALYSSSGNTNLTSLNLGSTLTTIGQYALYNRRGASLSSLPSTLTSIGNYGGYYLGYSSGSSFTFNPTNRCSIGNYGLQGAKIGTLQGQFSSINTYALSSCTSLSTVDIDVNSAIGTYAFSSDTALTSLGLTLLGSLGDYAFHDCRYVSTLNLDTSSVITSLGSYAFSRIGSSRANASTNPLTLDFSNSTFTTINAYCIGSDNSSYGPKYMDIIFPSTVSTISGSYAFRYTDNCNFFFSSETPPTLSTTYAWTNATNYKIFVPFGNVNAYRTASNWVSQASYIKGYSSANTFSLGDTLPVMNAEGYACTWYSDKACTVEVTTVSDASAQYYCVVGTEKIGWGITSVTALDCTVVITDGTTNYVQGSGVLAGTQLTISGIPTTSGWVPYMFTVNGVDVMSSLPYTLTVDSDISVMAIYYDGQTLPVNPVLDLNDWSIISSVSAAGTGANFWAVGDCKGVELSGTCGTLALSTTYYSYILGFNHNSALEGSGISFGTFKTSSSGGIDVCLTDSYYNSSNSSTNTYHMNTSNTNSGGWQNCQMRYSILGSVEVKNQKDATATATTSPVATSLMSCLPSSLRSVMKPITKYTNNVGQSNVESAVTTTTDYLPLLAEFEIFGARSYANQYEQSYQAQYQYYADGNSRIKYRQSATSTAANWWERSARYTGSGYFCRVYTSGAANYIGANFCYGVAPCFLI